MTTRDQMRKGSTEFFILRLLMERPMYGYEICQLLDQRSSGYFEMKEGLLYPALHRMQQKGWLSSEWQNVDGRSRKYYHLTHLGKEMMDKQAVEWKRFFEHFGIMMEMK